MNTKRNRTVLLGIWGGLGLAALVLAGATAPAAAHPAGSGHDVSVELHGDHEGQVTIVTVDEDGRRHEETFEFDAEHPPGFLGISFEEDDEGLRVTRVQDDSPAERAGLKRGDVIVGFDGRSVSSRGDLLKQVWGTQPGDRVEIELLRDGSREDIQVELGERKWFGREDRERLHERLGFLQERLRGIQGLELDLDLPRFRGQLRSSRPLLGVELVDTTPELREHLGGDADRGVLVGRVMADMPAAEGGIEVGDLIVAIDGEEIQDVRDLREALIEGEGRTIDVEVIRDGRSVDLGVYLPDPEEKERKETRGPRA